MDGGKSYIHAVGRYKYLVMHPYRSRPRERLVHISVVLAACAGCASVPDYFEGTTPSVVLYWEGETHISCSMVTCQGSTRSELP